ncbi:MAG: hypothetical protein SFV21_05090 [Rhodospirillaceae bacterium]|nr:hypothetical protein [Rhodospirillaceae bacterium]
MPINVLREDDMKDQVFFSDPAIDRLMGVVVGLASELHIARSRCRALEGVLVRSGVIAADAVDRWQPDAAEAARAAEELAGTVRTLFQHCLAGDAPGR